MGSPSTAWSTSAVAGKPSQPFIVEKVAQNHKVHKSSKYTPLIEHINNSWKVRKSLSTSAVAGKPRVISEEIPTTALRTSTSSCQAHTEFLFLKIKFWHITRRWKATVQGTSTNVGKPWSTSAVAGKLTSTSPGGGKQHNSIEHFSSCWQAQSAHHPEVESYCPDRYRHNILL